MQQILIVDDNPDIIDALDLLLTLHDYSVLTASSVQEALSIVERKNVDLVIQDMNFSEGTTSGDEGKKLFTQLRQLNPDLPIIIITAWTQLEMAIALVKDGAADYLPKPWDDKKLLDLIGQYALQQQKKSTKSVHIIHGSQQTAQLLLKAEKVAKAGVNVLITGPNGAGKEKLADYIHQHSGRHSAPLIKVNMGALPDNLMEAELFGATKGAFTGATQARDGRFAIADGGTLFLDEIGNLSTEGQAKLLRVLQTGEFEPVGSSQTVRVDVNIISATNVDLKLAVSKGQFREDLYFRLNVVELDILPLSQRKKDILPLARYFLGEDYTLTEDAEHFLTSQPWPGNIRQLENACNKAKVFANGHELDVTDFSEDGDNDPLSKDNIESVLDKHDWVIKHAATELGLSRQALYRRMEKMDIKRESL